MRRIIRAADAPLDPVVSATDADVRQGSVSVPLHSLGLEIDEALAEDRFPAGARDPFGEQSSDAWRDLEAALSDD